MMKKTLLGMIGLVALGLATPAVAADFPATPYTKTVPMIPAYYDWSGLYIGLNGGGGSAHKCWDINSLGGAAIAAVREGCHNATGGVAGGQAGFRWQAASWVFGVELQGDWANFRGSNTTVFAGGPAPINQSRVNAFGLLTGQIGYAFDTVLGYVKGGGAVANDRYYGLVANSNVWLDTADETRWGGAIGAGLEFAIAPGWSIAAEYDHLFMGTKAVNFTTQNGLLTRVDRIKQDVDIGTIRINYRWGGPVIPKY